MRGYNGAMINDNQVRWRCRRGTRELDALLNRFLDAGYPALEPAAKECFGRLLEQKDPEIYDWLVGRKMPEDEGLAAMVRHIRATIFPGEH